MNLLLEGEQTERLLFRKVRPSDFEAWLSFHEDKRSSEFWEGLPTDPKIACQEQFDRIFERYENNLGGMNALISKSTGEFIGLCGLLKQTVDQIEELEIGYSILPNYWKQGYASEAAIKCKNCAKEQSLAKSLISIIHIDNLPSQKVALKNGMYLDKTTTYYNNPVHIFRVLL
ncbi:GNAT family N-acetyltransferase [Zobellia barbeyronii]|uniref:GNAT family N-acetyltransferase n=1 Tax=Zobellia barbeyronii TaxID=2748009 RepID=A0ABS5WFQ3_9FLAO|nr:GNAT family N-acetyltransferase [Zobellia barbeyronii]MBT2162213.1 GNAT family N-acetyltransferase [Zobellia barbeyronii]